MTNQCCRISEHFILFVWGLICHFLLLHESLPTATPHIISSVELFDGYKLEMKNRRELLYVAYDAGVIILQL